MTDQERFHRARHDPALTVLEGFHAIKHAIRFGAELEVVLTDALDDVMALCASLAPDIAAALRAVVRESAAPIEGLTPTPPRTRIIAIARRPGFDPDAVFSQRTGLIVLLDQPRHPGNVGAAIRVAAAAGAQALVTTGSTDPWSPAALRGGAGLQYALPVGRIDALPASGRPVVALDPAGVDSAVADLPADAILVFGSERSGITAKALGRADLRVRIPMRPGVSSLNLATSVAAVLYGIGRQRS